MSYLVLFWLVAAWHTDGACMTYQSSETLSETLGDFNTVDCFPLKERTKEFLTIEDVSSTKLKVDAVCVNTTNVELEALVAGHRVCSEQLFLATWLNESSCPHRQMCSASEVTYNDQYDVTICRVSCPKRALDDGSYEVELLEGLSYTSWSVCGLQLVRSQQWTAPLQWSVGDLPAIYRSFESDIYLELKGGARLMFGNLNGNAVKLTKSLKQWASLGDLSLVACLPKPRTCGPEGASLSVWLKIDGSCSEHDGYISSQSFRSNGFSCRCREGKLRFEVRVLDRYFVRNAVSIPFGWFHLALVFHGPEDGEGITIHRNEDYWTSRSLQDSNGFKNTSGTVIIGRLYSDRDSNYGNVMADELTFWNRQLTEQEVDALRNMHQ